MAAEQNQLCNSWWRIENTCEGRKEEARRKGNQYTAAGGGGGIRVDKSKQAFVRSRGFVRIVRCMQPRGRRRAREEKEDRKSKRKKSLLR